MAGQIKEGSAVRIIASKVPMADGCWFVVKVMKNGYLCERHVGFSTYIFQKHEVEPWVKESST